MKELVIKHFLIFFLFGVASTSAQEVLLPLGSMFKDATILSDENATQKPFIGTGLFPVMEGSVRPVYYENKSDYISEFKWFRRKLFHQHFVEIQGDDYFLAIDPLINASLGQERSDDTRNLFQNTRAFQVTGEVMNRVSFYTGFYENQARFAQYQENYFEDRGEKRYNEQQEQYLTLNAVVPGAGRTKPFKEDAFDYASSLSYIRYRINDKAAVQLGNTPNFVGWGHRSMLLSDNSFNATALRGDFTINEKWSYSVLRSKHLNLYRRIRRLDGEIFSTAVEEPYEKKNYGAHYLTYQPVPQLTLGFFEANVYFREDSIHSQWMHPLYFNPVAGLNTAVFGWENQQAKSLVGMNAAWQIGKSHMAYAQLVTDDLSRNLEYGVQLGWRSKNPFELEGLDLQIEFNRATERLYAANNRRLAYTHFNLPLAHTLGNGFDELIFRLNYMYKNFYFQFHTVYYRADQPMENQTHLFLEKTKPSDFDRITVNYNEIELGYRFNPRTNLRLFTKLVYRNSAAESGVNTETTLVFFGLKTGLFNNYTDF